MLRSNRFSRTESSTEPITVEEARAQCRIDGTEEDADLFSMITEARRDCENRLGDKSLINATCIDHFDRFAGKMELHYSPVASTTHVKYYDTNGTLKTLSSDTYELGVINGIGVIRLQYNQDWPSDVRDHPDSVVVTYTAGYGTAVSNVPAMIRRWIKARVGWLYGNRDGEEYPWVFDTVLDPYRTSRVFA